MLLAVDVGNTQTVFGLFEGDSLSEQFRVGTDRSHTGDELAVLLRAFVDLASLDGIVLCSSVPQLVHEYETFAERWAQVPLLVLGPGVPTGMAIRYDDPREVGADRIANAVAARERHGAPAVVVDFGTSTNFDVVSAAGEFAGGVCGDRAAGTISTRRELLKLFSAGTARFHVATLFAVMSTMATMLFDTIASRRRSFGMPATVSEKRADTARSDPRIGVCLNSGVLVITRSR